MTDRPSAFQRNLASIADEFGPDSCWSWPKSLDPSGYGRTYFQGTNAFLAHRAAYLTMVGPIPQGQTLDHLCRNRACVNPDHLEPVTRGENVRRGNTFQGENSRKTHCLRGHELAGENLALSKTKWGTWSRVCRTCKRDRSRQARARVAS